MKDNKPLTNEQEKVLKDWWKSFRQRLRRIIDEGSKEDYTNEEMDLFDAFYPRFVKGPVERRVTRACTCGILTHVENRPVCPRHMKGKGR